jgi:hypothetical protein
VNKRTNIEISDVKAGRRYIIGESYGRTIGTAVSDAVRIENSPGRCDGWGCLIREDQSGQVIDFYIADNGGAMYPISFWDITPGDGT